MAQSKQDSDTPADLGQAFLKQFESAGFGPMHWIGQDWFTAMAEMHSEAMTFIAERIKEDAKTQQALARCKSAEELQKVQLAFLEKARQQYADETGKLVKMGLDLLPRSGAGTKHTPV
ncbi:MAG: phasin family protein [Yoonia sp.]|uniref:phasin family protein n=1 Tax=Yoonia sp. TaxID=2212373 RepID=UPI003EF57076